MTYQTQTTQQTPIEPIIRFDDDSLVQENSNKHPCVGIKRTLDNWIVESLKLNGGYLTFIGDLEDVMKFLDREFGTKEMSGRWRLMNYGDINVLKNLQLLDQAMREGIQEEHDLYLKPHTRTPKESVDLLYKTREKSVTIQKGYFKKIKVLLNENVKEV